MEKLRFILKFTVGLVILMAPTLGSTEFEVSHYYYVQQIFMQGYHPEFQKEVDREEVDQVAASVENCKRQIQREFSQIKDSQALRATMRAFAGKPELKDLTLVFVYTTDKDKKLSENGDVTAYTPDRVFFTISGGTPEDIKSQKAFTSSRTFPISNNGTCNAEAIVTELVTMQPGDPKHLDLDSENGTVETPTNVQR